MVTPSQAFNSMGLELKPSPFSLLPPEKLHQTASFPLFLPHTSESVQQKRKHHGGNMHQECVNPGVPGWFSQ